MIFKMTGRKKTNYEVGDLVRTSNLPKTFSDEDTFKCIFESCTITKSWKNTKFFLQKVSWTK